MPLDGSEERQMRGLRPVASVPFRVLAREPDTGASASADLTSFPTDGSEVEHLRDLVAQLMHKTAHDPLTALPTRNVLLEQLEHELARDASDGAQLAVLFVDLDNFKLVFVLFGFGCGVVVLCVLFVCFVV